MSGELFEAPFNLSGESQSSELTVEGAARAKAEAEAIARKAQALLVLETVPYDQPLNNQEQSALDYLQSVELCDRCNIKPISPATGQHCASCHVELWS